MKKFRKMIVLLTICCLFFTACGGSSDSAGSSGSYKSTTSYDMAAAEEAAPAEAPAALEEAIETEAGAGGLDSAATVEGSTAETERKLIRTIDMSVETQHYDELLTTLQQQIRELGGYIEHKDAYNGSQTSGALRYISMTVRIPSDRLDAFVDRVGEECNVIRESEYVEDVTLTYVDMDSHRQMLAVEQQRLLELLEKAETIEDIIALESRLSEVRYEIESIASQLRTYDNLVDYSTVYLYIDEVERYTPVQEKTDLEKIKSGFGESLYQVGRGIKNFIIEFIISIPYLVVWGAVLVALAFLLRLIRKKRREKRSHDPSPETGKKAAGTLFRSRRESRWKRKEKETEESHGSEEPRL
ncbi:MAG: DUF4349 domain-containing protein [Lachnospiraceae bacterium]|nr:DUF4349 domain-containing protein [Lachnospiraceae bacterium]